MIRIRPGRAWRQDAGLLSRLRASNGDRTAIVDAVAIEVDGVDLAAGIEEDSVLQVTAELAAAVACLASGAPRASVGFRAAGVELLLERRRERVRLSLVRLRQPAGRAPRGVEVDLEALRGAALESSRALLRELGGINPALLRGPAARRLASAVRRLGAGRTVRPAALARTEAVRVAQAVTPGLPGCAFAFEDGAARIASFRGTKPDLQSLLVQGRLRWRLTRTESLWEGDGYLFLMLREQTAAGLALVRGLEAGEAEHVLPLSDGGRLAFDLTGGAALLPSRPQPVRCDAAALARSFFLAARRFVAIATAWNPRQSGNGYLTELRLSAEEGLARCLELERPLPRRRGRARRRKAPPPAELPLVEGRLRRLRYRRLWTARVPQPRGLCSSGSTVAVCSEAGVRGLSVADGRTLWSLPRGNGHALALPDGGVVAAAAAQVVRFGATGAPQWSAKPLGSDAATTSLALSPGGESVAVASGAEVALLLVDRGRTLWRFAPPGCGALAAAVASGLCLVATSDGRLYGIEAGPGRMAWRARVGAKLASPLVFWEQRVAVLSRRPGGASVHAVDLADGRQLELPDLELTQPGSLCVTNGTLVISGTLGGEGRVVGYDASGRRWPWRGPRLGPGLPQLCPTPEGVVVRSASRLACVTAAGEPRWDLPFEDEVHGGPPPLLRRGVLFALSDQGLLALDPRSGQRLGEAGGDEPLWPALIAADDRLGLVCAEEEGALEAHGLETFLSVVG